MTTVHAEVEPLAPPEAPVFRFLVTPGEGADMRDERWNHAVTALAESGLYPLGTGPDLDWPISYQFKDPEHPEGAFYEVYHVVSLDHLPHYFPDTFL